MTKRIVWILVMASLLLGGPAQVGAAEATQVTAVGTSTRPSTQPATQPAAKKNPRHEEFVKIAKAGNVEVLFIGDSITDFWRRAGKGVWARDFAPLKAANFGISGDNTQGVLWRLQNGELEGIHPKVVVLLIGTNNREKAEVIASGIKDIITEIQTRSPGTRILLHGIFPRGEKVDGGRAKFAQINAILATYAEPNDPRRVVFIDIGDKFLNPDKTMNKELMPDTLHPSEKGYELWAGEIIETVKQLMKTEVKPATAPAKSNEGA